MRTNLKLIAFCLENNLTVDLKTLDTIFFCAELNIIEIFAKNYVDLSAVKFGVNFEVNFGINNFKVNKYNTLIVSLKNNGLDMMVFLRYLLKNADLENKKMRRIYE